jgi:glycosyltransferase involved in cell wall biosynthesis
MRIALVHCTFAVIGGAERYVRDLARSLTERGHEVRIFTAAPRLSARLCAHLPALARKALVHLGDLADPTGLRLRDVHRFAPDVVHVHNWQGLGILPVARLSRAYPTCHTVHDHAICDPNNALGTIGRSGVFDAFLSVRSAFIARRLRRTTLIFAAERTWDTVRRIVPGIRGHAVRILPLAVPGPRRSWPAGRRDVFLFLGALSPHKGVHLLLDSWRSDYGTLLVGGDGPLRADVQRIAGATASVRFLGYVDGAVKRASLAAAGWLVFPSQSPETFSLVCAEALSAGRPIITARVARPPMAADTSLLTFQHPAELPAVLERAASMPEADYRRMAASAAADGGKLDWDGHVDALLHLYRTAGSAP